MKKSFSRSLVGKLFGARTEASKKAKSAKLGLEMLEERQMLSVAPSSVDASVPVVEAAASLSETPPISFALTSDVNNGKIDSSTSETSLDATSSNYTNSTNEDDVDIVTDLSTPPDITSVISTGDSDKENEVGTVSISGYIESTNRHEVISNCVLSATWTIDEKENFAYTITDEYGFYTFDAVAADTAVNLAFVSGAYNLSTSSVNTYSATDIIGLNMSATLLGTISGKITDSSNSPVTDIAVTAYHNDENIAFAVTDENGNYSFENLIREDYTVLVDTAGLYKAVTAKTVSLAGNLTQNLDFVVSQGSRLTGVVTDDSGNPLEGIDVVAVDSLDNTVTATTDEKGQYCINGLETGKVDVYFISDSYADPGEQTITVDETDEVLNIQLVQSYTVSGTIYDSEGNPASGILVYLTDSEGADYFGVTNEEGTYSVDGLPPGEYTCEVYDAEYEVNLTDTITILASDVENVNFTLVSVDENMLLTSGVENIQTYNTEYSITDWSGDLASTDSKDAVVLATGGVGEWWKNITSQIDKGYTDLTAALNEDYRRQNGYYESITALLSKLSKLEPKDGCHCGYNEKIKAYNEMLDNLKQFQTDAKKELNDLKNTASEINKTKINITSSIADIILNVVPGSALVKCLKALNDVYQFTQFASSINEVIDIAPELASGFKSFLNDCQTSVKDSIDYAINAIKTFTVPISRAFTAAEYGSDGCEKLAILIVNLRKCDTKPLKAAIKATSDMVNAKLDELSKFEKQIDKLYDIYKPSSSNRAQQIQKFIEAKNLKEAEIYEHIGTEYRLKAEYELQLQNWSAEKAAQVSKIKTQAKSIRGMFKIGPVLSVVTNAMSIYSDFQKLKKLNSKIQKEYNECNDTMYKYRVEVQKAVNTKVPECTCKKTIDVVFCIDTTGSMGGSIASVKSNAIRMVQQLDRSDFDYTISIVLYKDFGDTYVTQYVLGYSNNMSSITSTINSITVSGGGDEPEAANTALMRCVNVLKSSKATQKLIITMSDAPGHSVDENGQTMQNVLYWTNKLNIKISTSLTGVYASASAVAPVVLEDRDASTSAPLVTSGSETAESYWKYMTSESGGKLYYSSNANIVDDFIAAIDEAANAPVISISADKYGFTYTPVSFDASATIAVEDRTVTLYEWDWNNDGIYDYSTDKAEVEHIYTYDYAGPVRLRVTDNAGYQNVAFTNVVIANTTDKAFLFTNEAGTEDLVVCAYNVEDTISIKRGTTEGSVLVDMTDVVLATNEFTPTGSIIIKAYGNTNNITIDGGITSDIYVYGGSGIDTLIYDNSASTTEKNYFLADGMIRTDSTNLVYENIDAVQVLGSSFMDVFELQASEKIQYTLDGGTENDSLQVSADSSRTNLEAVVSNIETATDVVATALATPVGMAIYGSRKINVQWNAVDNASGYMVEAATTSEFRDKTTQFFTTETSFTFKDLGQFSSYFFRVTAIGNEEFLNSETSAVITTEIPEVLNTPEWNLTDYADYKSFKLDATTDDNYTASLYGQEKDGSYTLLKAWDYVGADASATITGDSKVAENLMITASASKLLGAIDFNGGTCSRDTLFIEETDGDDLISIDTEEVVTTTPIYTSNPYEKLLANYEARFGATSKTYLRLKDCYDAAYARLAKMVKTNTSAYGIVDLDGGAKVRFIGVKAITVDAGAGNDSFNVGKLRFNYTLVGGEGVDALDFSNAAASVNVNPGAAYRQAPIAGDCGLMRLDDEFEAVVGSKFNDFVTGGVNGATIDGNGGSDSVVLIGGVNQVALTGKYQSVVIRGAGVYNVALTDADYSNVNAASASADARVQLNATGDHIALYGGLGTVEATVQGDYASINCGATTRTTANVQGDYATVVSGKGADVLGVVGDNATVDSNGGDDQIDVQGGAAVVSLGDGNDVAFLADGADGKTGGNYVNGESGDDFIFAANTTGRNYFHAGAGNDVIFGGAGQDYIYATSGVNALFGLSGVDRLYGSGRRDVLAASRPSNLENLETTTREELLQLYANLHENWIEEGALDKTVELLGENSLADGAKDWLFTYRHSDDLVYANQEDVDYVSGVPYGPNWSYLD